MLPSCEYDNNAADEIVEYCRDAGVDIDCDDNDAATIQKHVSEMYRKNSDPEKKRNSDDDDASGTSTNSAKVEDYRHALMMEAVQEYDNFLGYWERDIWNKRVEHIRQCYMYDSYEEARREERKVELYKLYEQEHNIRPSIENIPKGLRTKVLLKLLKHSMSELQRDHQLSQAIILSMVDNQCFEGAAGVEAMRYFFLTFVSEYVYNCNGDCHSRYLYNRNHLDEDSDDDDEDDDSRNPRPTVYCDDYSNLFGKVKFAISDGIKYMTQDHGNMIVGLIVHLFNIAGWNEVEKLTDLMGYDDDDSVNHSDKPYQLIIRIITGVGVKAYEDRCRLKCLLRWKYDTKKRTENQALEEEIYAVKESHLKSVDTLVRIGKVASRRLPADTVTEHIGSKIVRFLVLSSIDLIPHENCARSDACSEQDLFIGDRFGEGINESITNYNRYVEGICEFKMKDRRLHDIKRTFLDFVEIENVESDDLINEVFLSPPSRELQLVVKTLFLSQLVDVDFSGCGYGDFLVWCRLPIHIYEPMLYEHIVHYPSNYLDEDEESSDDEEPENRLKYYDDEGNLLKGGYLYARYDFSLLLLRKAWTAPWSFQNHSSYQLEFREAVWTLLLCAHRYGMSSDIPYIICSFLPRSFWPDERIKCWRYECEVENMDYLLYNRGSPKNKPSIICANSLTAHACNQKHMNQILHEGLRRTCKLPPMRTLNHEDEMFCKNFAVKKSDKIQDIGGDRCVDKSSDSSEDDNDSCWESIGSEENEEISEAEVIYRYFETNAYKFKRLSDGPAFASFYTDS